MDTDGIDVFHIADCDHIACAVAHDFIFDLFPACDAALYQDLADSGQTKSVGQDLVQLVLVRGNAAARAAQSIRRTQNDRIAYAPGKGFSVFDILDDLRRCDRLMDLLHGFLELKSVLRSADRSGRRSDQPDAVVFEEASLLKLHCQVQTSLSSQRGKDAVRFLFLYDLFHDFNSQRFDIYMIRYIPVRHDRSGIRIQEHDFDSLFFQASAGLGPRIVKLSCLSDHDRAGADHKYFFYVRIFRHGFPVPFLCASCLWRSGN